MPGMQRTILVLLILLAVPLFASHRFEWYAVPVDDLCLAQGANVHATGLEEHPYVALVKVPAGCHSTPTSVTCPSVYIPPTDFSAEAFPNPGAALGAYHETKLLRKRNAWLFTVDQEGTTILVTRKK